MFRIASGDPWPDSLPILGEDGSIDYRTCLYMCSFIVIVCWVAARRGPPRADSRARHAYASLRRLRRRRGAGVPLASGRMPTRFQNVHRKFQNVCQMSLATSKSPHPVGEPPEAGRGDGPGRRCTLRRSAGRRSGPAAESRSR